ncbi:MAG: HlyD family efflux transporter periplasmic adaptor subunit [Chloroflexi bacterium]|nr:HlyD family efflux transporter periplasmic adaptor subunit [Chloroflexota bacterium]
MMRNGTRLGVLVGLPVLLVAIGAVLAALVWLQQRSESPLEQALNDRRPATARTESSSATAPAATGGRQAVAVRRGSIADQLTVQGRVAAADEVLLGFGMAGRVENVAVKPGDSVQEGQLLVEASADTTQRDLTAARGRLELGSLRMEQAQQQAQAKQRDAERRKTNEQAKREQAVRDAESLLRKAQADYERIKAGPSEAERLSAQAAIQSAQAAFERAQADYQRAFAGPSDLDVRAQDQQTQNANLQLQKAQADLDKLSSGPNPDDLREAERDLLNAQNTYAKTLSELERLSKPDQATLSSAEREVQRAELTLRQAQSMKTNDRSSRTQRDIAVQNAQSDLQAARDRLNVARQGPPAYQVESARRDLIAARSAVDTARERLEQVRRGPTQLQIEQARAQVQAAQIAVEQAQAKQQALQAGPSEETVSRLAIGVQQAQAQLAVAQQQWVEFNARPSKNDVRDAEERLAAAQATVEQARQDAEAEPPEDIDTTAYDLQVLERSIAQDRAQVDKLEKDLAQTRLIAPFAGTISSVKVRPGDPFEQERAVLTLAKPGDPVLRADVTDRESARLSAGQPAVARIDGPNGGEFDATVEMVLEGDNNAGRVAQLTAAWPMPLPQIGTPVQVAVTLQEKTDVLLVPQKAIRTAGARKFVEVVDGPNRTMTDVEVGIVSNGQAEILSGLRQDQLVLVGP